MLLTLDVCFRSAYIRRMNVGALYARWTWLLCFFTCAACFAQNADSVRHDEAVAIVGGETIREADLLPAVQAQLFKLRTQEYDLKKKALDTLIEQKLLQLAAKKKGTTTENLLQQDVDGKVPEPTDAELQAYYLGQKDKLNRPFDEVKDQLRVGLKQARIQEARQAYLRGLRKDSDVRVLLDPPRIRVGYDRAGYSFRTVASISPCGSSVGRNTSPGLSIPNGFKSTSR